MSRIPPRNQLPICARHDFALALENDYRSGHNYCEVITITESSSSSSSENLLHVNFMPSK
jgi:hypothetical protein